MTTQELTREAFELSQEKGWDCSPEVLACLHMTCGRLTEEGVPLDREMIEFILDVIQVKRLLGLSSEASDDEIAAAKQVMIEWLEALGWRRAWFMRDLQRAQ
jgi:hypothetical protein